MPVVRAERGYVSPGAERGGLHHPRWDVDAVGCSHGAMQEGFLQRCVSCNKSWVSNCVWSSCRFYFTSSMFPQLGDPSSNSSLGSPLPSPACHFPGIMKSGLIACPSIRYAWPEDVRSGQVFPAPDPAGIPLVPLTSPGVPVCLL